jgi:hypothetical protein
VIATKRTITRMRHEAEVLRRNLCLREAELLELWAAEFAAGVEEDENELLTRPEARRYSRYSEAQFRVLEREKTIVAIDTPDGPRYRKAELPRRPKSDRARKRKIVPAPEPKATPSAEETLSERIRASARSAARAA